MWASAVVYTTYEEKNRSSSHPGDNLTIRCRTAMFCSGSMREKTSTEQEEDREEEGRGAAGLIDSTIWKRREAGSLMSLRIDEDKTGPGSTGNNSRGLAPALHGPCPSSAPPLMDGFYHMSSIRRASPLCRK